MLRNWSCSYHKNRFFLQQMDDLFPHPLSFSSKINDKKSPKKAETIRVEIIILHNFLSLWNINWRDIVSNSNYFNL
jgi:hypothetical protein